MPLLKALRQASLLNNTQLAQLAKAMEDLAEMRKANDPVKIKAVLTTARQSLRSNNCMAVAGPLLDALKSAEIIRKELGKRDWEGEPGDVWISIKLPSTGSTSASIKPLSKSATVHVSWLLEAQSGDHGTYCSWDMNVTGFGNLFSVYEERYDSRERGESSYNTAGIVEWMRQNGLMGEGASPRQQFELVYCAISALFQLAGKRAPDDYSESCVKATGYEPEPYYPQEAVDAAFAARRELPEPPMSLEEQEDDREGRRQLEEHMRLGTVFMSDVNNEEHDLQEPSGEGEEEEEREMFPKAPATEPYVFKFGEG